MKKGEQGKRVLIITTADGSSSGRDVTAGAPKRSRNLVSPTIKKKSTLGELIINFHNDF